MRMHFRQTLITTVRLTPLKATADAPDPDVPPLFLHGLRMHVVRDHVPEHFGGGTNYRLYAEEPDGTGRHDRGIRRVLERLDVTPWWAHTAGHELVAWSPGRYPEGVVWTRLTLGPVRVARPGRPYPELPDDPHRVGRTLVLSLVTDPVNRLTVDNLREDPAGPEPCSFPAFRWCGTDHDDPTDPDHGRDDLEPPC